VHQRHRLLEWRVSRAAMRGFAGAREQLIGPEYNLTNKDDYLLSLMICISAILSV
jgi:hypothetical protein